jgi:23S rRNA maturation mini-RNase III
MKDKPKVPEYYFDIRVRERLVASGTLDSKVLEQHVAELVDLEAQAVSIDIDQPALNPRDSE